jgi:GT2 family glycosyltransferase
MPSPDPSTSKDPRGEPFGAVVLTLGTDASFQSVVTDLIDQGVAPEAICVVHNRPSTGDPPVSLPASEISTIELENNVGYAGGMNLGISFHLRQGAEWIWVLTQDVRLRVGAVGAMRQATQEARTFGAVGPVICDPASGEIFSAGGRQTNLGGPRHRTQLPSVMAAGAPFALAEWL